MSTQRLMTLCALAVTLSLAAGARANYVSPYTADANTVVLYHLDETAGATTAVDASGNGFDLTASTSPFDGGASANGLSTAPTFGKVDGGKQLRRTMTAPDLANFDTTSFTIEAWAKNPDLTSIGDHNGILAYRGSTGRFQFSVFGANTGANAGKLNFNYNRDDTGAYYGTIQSNGLTWETDKWYHVVVTYDSNTAAANDSIVTFYRNSIDDVSGIPQMVGQLTGQPDIEPLDAGSTLNLGGFETNNQRNFAGYLDEVRWSNGVLTSFNLAIPTPAALPAGLMMMGLIGLRRRCR